MILVFLPFVQLNAQVIHFKGKFKKLVRSGAMEVVHLKPVEKRGTEKDKRYKHLEFAKLHEVNINMENQGYWTAVDDNLQVWRVQIESPGALSLGVNLTNFKIHKGSELYLTNANGAIFGPLTCKNNKESKILPVQPLAGDNITFNYFVPTGVNRGNFTISGIGRGYKNVFNLMNNLSSDTCHIDINCLEGKNWQSEKRAVCKIIINNRELCSGVLVNNTSDKDIPYLLTANHCISSNIDAATSVFFFNYENIRCNEPGPYAEASIASATLKATTTALDFSLVELSKKPPFWYLPYYAGWSVDTFDIDKTVSIHHPQGDVKKISLDDDAPIISNFGSGYDKYSHWLIKNWEVGTTEPGSSGAPLFNQNQKVIGTLTGGQADCEFPVNDYFSMFSRAWDDYDSPSNQLAYWLDPLGLGVKKFPGYFPYMINISSCDTVSNHADIEGGQTYMHPGGGYIGGPNKDSTIAYAERVNLIDSTNIMAGFVEIGINVPVLPPSRILMKIWEGGVTPGEVIAQKFIYLDELEDSIRNYIEFDSVIAVHDDIFIGYEVFYKDSLEMDSFAVLTYTGGELIENHAYAKVNGQWEAFSSDSILGVNSSLGLAIITCKSGNVSRQVLKMDKNLMVYPNPSDGNFTIRLPNEINRFSDINLNIYDMQGRQVAFNMVKDAEKIARVSLYPGNKGIFFVVLKSKFGIHTGKIIIIK
jgi:hypothetical protein